MRLAAPRTAARPSLPPMSAPPRSTNLDGGPNGRPRILVVVPGAIAAVTAFAILGAGGAPRPPIAPRYTGEPGQEPAQVAAALLDSKRHRPRELLVEVSGGTSGEVKEALARDYRAEIAELGTVELAGVRIWHLTLGPAGNLRETLTALLQDQPRADRPAELYLYACARAARKKTAYLPGNGAALAPPPGKLLPTGAGVKLAIIDTCVEGNHDELQGSIASSFNAAGPGFRQLQAGKSRHRGSQPHCGAWQASWHGRTCRTPVRAGLQLHQRGKRGRCHEPGDRAVHGLGSQNAARR